MRSRSGRAATALAALLGLMTLAVVPSRGTGDERRPATPAVGPEDARPLFESYCFGCHADGIRKGGLDLDKLLDAKDRAAARPEWEKIRKAVRHEFMPPSQADRPSDEERRTITRWIEREVFGADEARPDPVA